MKVKLQILLTIIFVVSIAAFGQKSAGKNAGKKPTPKKMPSVQEILTKYERAVGGRTANEKLKNLYSKGVLEIMPVGVKGVFESYAAPPNKFHNKTSLVGVGDIIEGFDGQTAWIVSSIQGNRDKTGEELAQTKLTYDFYRETNLAELYPKMELKGTEKVGENDAYIIVGTPVGSPPETFYFDTKSGFLVQQDVTVISPDGKIPMKTFFDDVREIDGVKVPFKIRSVLPEYEIYLTMTEVKHNVAIEAEKFAKPKE